MAYRLLPEQCNIMPIVLVYCYENLLHFLQITNKAFLFATYSTVLSFLKDFSPYLTFVCN